MSNLLVILGIIGVFVIIICIIIRIIGYLLDKSDTYKIITNITVIVSFLVSMLSLLLVYKSEWLIDKVSIENEELIKYSMIPMAFCSLFLLKSFLWRVTIGGRTVAVDKISFNRFLFFASTAGIIIGMCLVIFSGIGN